MFLRQACRGMGWWMRGRFVKNKVRKSKRIRFWKGRIRFVGLCFLMVLLDACFCKVGRIDYG